MRMPTRWNALADVPSGFGPSVVTIGNFDGVHRGHVGVIGLVADRARARGAQAVGITFEPHPVAVLHPERAPEPLTGTEHKLELLGAAGLDAVLVMTFTTELAGWSPRRFVQEVIVDALGASLVVVGADTRFGYRNSGTVETMRELGEELGFDVEVLPELGIGDLDGELRRWSSTWVRELVAAGDVERAAEVLGRPHRVGGVVVHGDHRGRELGYPTANVGAEGLLAVPADGVYAGWLSLLDGERDGGKMPAAISIGTNPTFDGRSRRVEAYVLDRTDLDIYGRRVALDFVARLRPTERFDDVATLVARMADDVERCRALLGRA